MTPFKKFLHLTLLLHLASSQEDKNTLKQGLLLIGESSRTSRYRQVYRPLRNGSFSRIFRNSDSTDDWQSWKTTGSLTITYLLAIFSYYLFIYISSIFLRF